VGALRISLFYILAIEGEMKNGKFKKTKFCWGVFLVNNLKLAEGFPFAMWCK